MTNITKAAQAALRDLADWHWSQATTLRKAARTTAIDKPEPSRSSLLRMADWHDAQKSIIRAALQDKAGEVTVAIDNLHNERRDGMTNAIFPPVQIGTRLFAAQPAPVVPAGFALVPVEPTDAMVQAGVAEMPHFTDEPGPVWSAMIAASQQPFSTPNQPKSHDS